MKKTFIAIIFLLYLSPLFASLNTPSLVSPANSSLNNYPDVVLDWSASTGATGYEYKLGTTPGLAGAVIHAVPGSSQAATSNLLFGNVYYWQVRAIKTTVPTDSSSWSATWNFTTINQLGLVSPANAAINLEPNALLDWDYISGITFYDYQWDTTATFTSPLNYYGSLSGGSSQINAYNLRFGTKYFWRVRARHSLDTTQWSSVRNFTTTDRLTLVSPATGAANQSPDVVLDWSPLSGITWYDYQWDTTATFTSPVKFYGSIAGGSSQINANSLRFGTKYFWRVRTRHASDTCQWSIVWNFTTIDKLTLVGPVNGATSQSPDVILDWSPLSGITWYDYQWDTTATFTSPVKFYGSVAGGSSQINANSLRFGTKYFWRVRTRHASDTTQWSVVWNFTTIDKLTLVGPVNGATSQSPDVILDWSPLSGITYYDYQWDTTATFTSPVKFNGSVAGGSSQINANSLRFGTKYFWRVRTRHASDTTQWSVVWNFTTIDKLTLVGPASGATNQSPDVILDWSTLSGITYYDYQWDTTATFTSPVKFNGSVAGGSSQINANNLRFGTKYYWRVRARHASDTTQWSVVWNFTTIANLTNISPADNSTAISLNPLLDWAGITGISGYQYRYSVNSNFTNQSLYTIGTTSQANLSLLSYGTKYYWQVRAFHSADTSAWSMPWSFTTIYQLATAPVLVSPVNGALNIPVAGTSLQWGSVSQASLYECQFDDNPSFTSPVINTVAGLNEMTGTLLQGTTYYWKVRAGNGSGFSPWSVTWSFTSIFQLTEAPSLVSPVNGITGIPVAGTSLQWSAVSLATFYEYQFDDNASFTSPVDQAVPALNDLTGILLPNTTYYWKVRAGNGSGFSPWSVTWSFTTVFQFTEAPALISPQNAAVEIPVAGTSLQWSAVNSATLYEYQFDDNASFTSPVDQVVTSLNVLTGNLLPNSTYYWKVRAGNGSGFSPWSVVWSFTTIINTGITYQPGIEIISVYPNPSAGKFVINSNREIGLVEIYNTIGEKVFKSAIRNPQSEIDLTSQPRGIYFVEIYGDGKQFTKKIVIQ